MNTYVVNKRRIQKKICSEKEQNKSNTTVCVGLLEIYQPPEGAFCNNKCILLWSSYLTVTMIRPEIVQTTWVGWDKCDQPTGLFTMFS